MQPNLDLITITDNQAQIIRFLQELIIRPRRDIHYWSTITKQTPTLKIGYIGQHLTSLILGMEGDRIGARGHDIIDETEVKSCTKVDQVDKCKDCDGRVMRSEIICSHCNSTNIDRKDDSKWLFSVKTEIELNLLVNGIDRVFLLISDYPNFKDNDFSSIRFEGFEIHPKEARMSIFKDLVTDYYHNNYLPKAQANQKTSPMNFHPYKLQFYMCNPIKVFSANIDNIDTELPEININKFILPNVDRNTVSSEDMPTSVLNKSELLAFINNAPFDEIIKPLLVDSSVTKEDFIKLLKKTKKENWNTMIPYINELGRNYLELRDIVVAPQSTTYRRN